METKQSDESIKGKKVLVWKSWGEISVHSLETEEECKTVFDELKGILINDGFPSLGSQQERHQKTIDKIVYIQDLVWYINDYWVGHDWEMFETLRITYVE